MLFFLIGWVGFLSTGLIVSLLPDQRGDQGLTGIELLFEILILVGEICFALGQVAIVGVWWLVRRATVFVPASRSMIRNAGLDPLEQVREQVIHEQRVDTGCT
jgi:hypothetical protein